MKRLQDYFRKENVIAKAVPLIVIMVAITLILGSGVLAQFTRITGETGYGYGYGYGYGEGYGWDLGVLTGYRISTTTADIDVYGYGYGYGYMSDATSYNSSTEEFTTEPENFFELVLAGTIGLENYTSEGETIYLDGISFSSPVEFALGDLATVSVASGTVFSFGTTTTFSSDIITGTTTVSVSGLPSGYSGLDEAAIQFGSETLELTVSPAVTISINVPSVDNGTVLKILHKAPGGSWELLTTCTVADGVCSFETESLSSFVPSTNGSSSNTDDNISTGGGSFLMNNNQTAQTTTVVVTTDTTTTGGDVKAPVVSRGIKFNKNLKYKAQNNDVNLLQKFLIAQNKGKYAKALAKNGVTKYFGRLTENALKEYQQAVGLAVTGILDQATREYINGLNYIIDPVVKSGMLVRGSDMKTYVIKTVNKKLVRSYVSTLAELKKYKKAVVDISDGLLAKFSLVK